MSKVKNGKTVKTVNGKAKQIEAARRISDMPPASPKPLGLDGITPQALGIRPDDTLGCCDAAGKILGISGPEVLVRLANWKDQANPSGDRFRAWLDGAGDDLEAVTIKMGVELNVAEWAQLKGIARKNGWSLEDAIYHVLYHGMEYWHMKAGKAS